MENALPLIRDGYSLKFVFLPDGEDPDSLIREQGQQAFEQILAQAKPLSQFLFEQLSVQVDMNSLEGKSKVVDLFQPYLNKMPDSTLKDAILTELANKFARGSEKRLGELRKRNAQANQAVKKAGQTRITPVRLAIALLLEHPHIVDALPDVNILQKLNMPGIPLLNQLLMLCKQNPAINSAQLVEHYREKEEGKQLTKLMCLQHHIEPENAETVFLDLIESFLNTFIEQRTEQLLEKERISGLSKSEKQELHSLLLA